MANFASSALLLLSSSVTSSAFQTGQMLPMRIDPVPRNEISQRLGLKTADGQKLSIGSGPNMGYKLINEHEVVCPISGSHQGVLCTSLLAHTINSDNDDAESIADNHELVSQAIMSGALAASIRNRCPDGNSLYYLPFIVTLVESLMADEIESIDFDEMVFNSRGLETNEILMDWTDDEELSGEEQQRSVMLYACNTQSDQISASSDVYLLPSPGKMGTDKIWRFTVDYKVATINLQMIPSFGDRDSSTPLRPDVWLRDDCY